MILMDNDSAQPRKSLAKNETDNRSLVFRLSSIRWYELTFIILFSLFANIIATIPVGTESAGYRLWKSLCLFLSALFIFNIFATLNSKWQDKILGDYNDPIGEYYKSIGTDDKINVYLYLSSAAVCLVLFIVMSCV